MAKHAEFENSLVPPVVDYVISDTNTSNTNARRSITSTSGSIISLEFDNEELSSNSDQFATETIFVNQNKSQERSSIVDDTFRCKTVTCKCHTIINTESNILSASKYSYGSCLLSHLSGSYLNDNNKNLDLLKAEDAISIVTADATKAYKTFQDCKCIADNQENDNYDGPSYIPTFDSQLLNVTYTLSDDQGPEPDIPDAEHHLSVVEPDITTECDFTLYSASDSAIDNSYTAEFERNQLVYFPPDEVVVHNKPDDIWVSYLGNVYDLTLLIAKHKGSREIKPLLAFAGKDISDWFDINGELRHYIHPVTGVRVPYLPHGPIPDIRPQVPTTTWQPMCACAMNDGEMEGSLIPWWRCKKYFIGKLTASTRPIRIVNVLTLDECTLTVCCEDKLSRILERLLIFNSHATSYTFKYDTRVLDMDKTLDENHIFDERKIFLLNYLPEDTYIPALHLYFNDDLQWDLGSSDECDD